MATISELCNAHRGENFTGSDWTDASGECDWTGHYPVVDGNGNLTGDVFESGDPAGIEYANLDDEAMVLIANLPESEQARIRDEIAEGTWTGYANLG